MTCQTFESTQSVAMRVILLVNESEDIVRATAQTLNSVVTLPVGAICNACVPVRDRLDRIA